VAAAQSLARAVLVECPRQPEALRVLARCAYEQGRPKEGLTLVLDAARSMQTQRVDPPVEYLIWSDLGFMFGVALPGIDSALAADRRAAYARRTPDPDPDLSSALVTVVVVASDDDLLTAQSLRSISGQHCRDIDLVVVHAGPDPRADRNIVEAVATIALPVRWLHVPGASPVQRADAGVRAAEGELVNVLCSPHRFAPARVGAMREALGRHGAAWGFSGVEFVDANGSPLSAERDWQIRAWAERIGALGEADTIGFALIHQEFVVVDGSNLMFRRSLYDAVGGFRTDTPLWAWDFCLRAVLEAEPVFVPSREFVHVTMQARVPAPPQRRLEYETAQIAMFAAFYAFAATNTKVPNPFAPCVANWGLHFLKSLFHAGHVLALPLPELERLGALVLERGAQPSAGSLQPGIDLVGFAFGEFGLGENLRAFARACLLDGIPFGVKDVDMRLMTRQADRSITSHVSDSLRHNCAVYCLNPDTMKPIRSMLIEGRAAGRRNIGYWFWELEQIPKEWTPFIAEVDEIWVATEFIATAMRNATDKPVVKIPTPIDVTLSRTYSRREFGLPEDRFLFLFSFDFNSFVARKNPEAAILAFLRAFVPARRDAGLVIKSINGRNKPEAMQAMRQLIGNDDRIILVDEFFTRDEVSGLESVVDAYVSLHRAEGLGLGLAESMFLGKPVIGTRYSGNLEFMDDANSCLVDCTMIPIRKGEYLYDDARYQWADPDIEQASNWMRKLVDDVEFRGRIARRGREDIHARFTYTDAAARIRRRLADLSLL
jgi:glycosyltransferase involved in cell wall biosynthesis